MRVFHRPKTRRRQSASHYCLSIAGVNSPIEEGLMVSLSVWENWFLVSTFLLLLLVPFPTSLTLLLSACDAHATNCKRSNRHHLLPCLALLACVLWPSFTRQGPTWLFASSVSPSLFLSRFLHSIIIMADNNEDNSPELPDCLSRWQYSGSSAGSSQLSWARIVFAGDGDLFLFLIWSSLPSYSCSSFAMNSW